MLPLRRPHGCPGWPRPEDWRTLSAMTRDDAAVLFVNDAFYAVFAVGDMAAMEALWSSVVPVTCIHPGSGILRGRDVVLESWRHLLQGGGAAIRVAGATVAVHGDSATVCCYEVAGEAILAATNLFVREGEAWKLTHHQAGPTPAQPDLREPEVGALQ